MRLAFYRLLIVVVLVLVTVTPLAAQTDRPVIVAIGPEQPDAFIPDYVSLATTSYALSAIYSTLVQYDLNGEIVGDLAESWSVSDDQLTWTFNLRDDMTWHDGTPFTAADVVFTYEFRNSPDYDVADASELIAGAAAFKAGDADSISGVRATGDFTIELETNEPVATFLNTLEGEYILPAHLLRDIPIAQVGTSVYATSAPVGTGPYRVVSWTPDESLVMEAHEAYHGGTPNIRTYIWRMIPEPASQLSELVAGGVDMVGDIPADSVPSIENDPAITIIAETGVTQWYLTLNTQRAPFDDLRVRQAIAHAIDLETLLAATADGQGVITGGLVFPGLPERNPDLQRPAYDVDMARALLAEAGYEDRDGDGVLEAQGVAGVADGTPFAMVILAIADVQNTVRAQVLEQQLDAIGLNVTINTLDSNLLFSQYYSAGADFDAVVSGWSNLIVTPAEDLFYNYGSSGFWAAHGVANPAIDEALAAIPVTFDDDARAELHWTVERLVAEDLGNIYLDRPNTFLGIDADLIIPDGVESPAELFAAVYLWQWR